MKMLRKIHKKLPSPSLAQAIILDVSENGKPVTLAENAVFSDARVSVVRIRNRLIAYPMDGKWLHGDGFKALASGNPLNIRSPSDLAKSHIRLVNRETGAALRVLLDDCLARAGVPTEAVSGYDHLVASHSH